MIERGPHNQSDFEAPKAPQQGILIPETSRFREVVNFFRVSPVHQLLAAVNFATAADLGMAAAEKISQGNYDTAARLVATTLFNLAILGSNEALVVVKLSEYNKIKEALLRHGWDKRIIEPKSHSWCQRHAARLAAIDSGYKEEIDNYYSEEGYKWYHVIPFTRSK